MIRIADQVGTDHPSLPGHFPGNPLVPGVLLLARVARAAAGAYSTEIGGVAAVKFLSPLRPGERFEIELDDPRADAIGFRVLRSGERIAAGVLRRRMGGA